MNPQIEEVLCLLKYAIGLEPGALGRSTLKSLAEAQMRRDGFDDTGVYAATLAASPVHLQRLVEAVVVSESWFFREPVALERLVTLARSRTVAQPGTTLKLLCLPCANGEEPYSMAIVLLEAGISTFQIDALDISAVALEKAQKGTYSSYAFRGREPSTMQDYLKRTGDQYQVVPQVREKVTFRQANILDSSLARGYLYDVIFCRNLLIYLTPEARAASTKALRNVLAVGGELMVAACEAAALEAEAAEPIRRKANPYLTGPAIQKQKQPPLLPPAARWSAGPTRPTTITPQEKRPLTGDLLVLAKVHADAGELVEAERLCEASLLNGPSSQAYLLLGAIRAAQGGHEVAREHFRRSLYLDPHNVDALLQMAVYAERDGRSDLAQGLRRRAAKAPPAS